MASPGSWSLNGGAHTVAGNGADIWNAADEFRFVYQQLTGDGSITARLTAFTGTGTINANAKAGVMIRQDLTAGSPHLLSCLPPQNQATLIKQIRRVTAGAASLATTGNASAFPRWVRVTRSGTALSTWESTNGTSWTQVGTAQTIASLGANTFVGLAVSSHVDGTNYTATFDNVTITTPAPPTAPTGLSAMGGVNQATLTWTDTSNNETGFKIERKLTADPDTSFAQVGTAAVNATSFTNTTVPAGNYTYGCGPANAHGLGVLEYGECHRQQPATAERPLRAQRQQRREPVGPHLDRQLGQRDRLQDRAQAAGRSRHQLHPGGDHRGQRGHVHQQLGARGRLHLPGEGHQRLR